MKLIDLTLPVARSETVFTPKRLFISGTGGDYTAIVYDYHHSGMVSTYIDFPGHIEHLNDGTDAANCALEKLYRVAATVIHLDCADGFDSFRPLSRIKLLGAGNAPLSSKAYIGTFKQRTSSLF
jgi:hypothetical protein